MDSRTKPEPGAAARESIRDPRGISTGAPPEELIPAPPESTGMKQPSQAPSQALGEAIPEPDESPLPSGGTKGRCEVCGNVYAHSFQILLDGNRHVFDCFECAITALAPTCLHCGCRVIGHGIEAEGKGIYCCAHCARTEGTRGAVDRVPPA